MKHLYIFEKFRLEKQLLLLEKSIQVGDSLTKKLSQVDSSLGKKIKHFLNSNDIKDTAKISKIDIDPKSSKILFTLTDEKGNKRDFKMGKMLSYLGFDTSNVKQYEVEDFITDIKTADTSNLKMVEGEDILKSYNCNNYDDTIEVGNYTNGGGLNASCMRFDYKQKYLEIYTSNTKQVKCLTLFNPSNNKVQGRALIWLLDDGKRFIDRIYTITKDMKSIFNTYAEENNISHNLSSDVTLENGGEFDYYPYMDTLIYYSPDENRLSEDDGDYTLQSTEGYYLEGEEDMVYSSHLGGEEILRSEAVLALVNGVEDWIYEHDAIDVCNDINNHHSTVYVLEDGGEDISITYTSKKYDDFRAEVVLINLGLQLESGVWVLEGDSDCYEYIENDGYYVKNTNDDFSEMDGDSFCIEVTYPTDNKTFYTGYIPFAKSCSIWSLEHEKFFVIHEDNVEDFEPSYSEDVEFEDIYSTDKQNMGELTYLPDNFVEGGSSDIITKKSPLSLDLFSKKLDNKSGKVEIHDSIYLNKTDIDTKCVKTDYGYRVIPLLVDNFLLNYQYRGYLNSISSYEELLDYKKKKYLY